MQVKSKKKTFKSTKNSESISILMQELGVTDVDQPLDLGGLAEMAAQTGMADPNLFRFHKVILSEMRNKADIAFSSNIADLVIEWAMRRNNFFIDYATLKCLEKRIYPPPVLERIILKTLRQRFRIEERAGSPKNVIHQIAKSETLMLMLRMVYVGYSLKVASSKAARWMASMFPGHSLKASRLERMYSDEKKSLGQNGERSQQDLMFEKWHKSLRPDQEEQWRKEFSDMPEADDELMGTRHS